jgi:rfaE bifunctional protein kinase chain/domain/rfaE bifunctional protein nucleotidyltransferase chain/domain
MNEKKLINFNKISQTISKLKLKNKKIVHCHGVFDFFHLGHLKYFKSAKSYGDYLIVSLTSDRFVKKGFNRPFYKANQRVELLSSIDLIDFIVFSDSHNGEKIIEKIKPDFYVKGPDYANNSKDITGNIYKEIKLVKQFGGKVIYTNDETLSSSSLLNNHYNNLNEKQKNYQLEIKKKFSFDEIKENVNKLNSIDILAIGETILDQYVFSESIGKSGKEPHLVIRDLKTETYPGGIVAIAKHLESFTKNISIVSVMGESGKDFSFVRKNINKNTKFDFIKKKNSPSIVKKRYIDQLTNHKLIGVYSINDRDLNKKEEDQLRKKIFKKINKNTLLIISDYGHGFISKKLAKKICSMSKNIFLNTQLNAANIGYHTLRNYNNFNSLIINESELRHEFKDRHSDVKKLVITLSKLINVKNILVTRGANGAICYNTKLDNFYEAPAFANKIIDKVGAGDTLLALFSICLFSKINIEMSLFIASIAASISVESIGNSKSVDKKILLKIIEYFLK